MDGSVHPLRFDLDQLSFNLSSSSVKCYVIDSSILQIFSLLASIYCILVANFKCCNNNVQKFFKLYILYRGRFKGGGEEGATPLLFCNLLFFYNNFEELRTVLFEVELIIKLTYVCPNTIETCLTPNLLLFGRQLFHSSNTSSTVVRNLTVLSRTTDKINRIGNPFLDM